MDIDGNLAEGEYDDFLEQGEIQPDLGRKDALDDEENDMYEDDGNEDAAKTPVRKNFMRSSIAPTPLRTPKTPFRTPKAPKTPRTVQQSAKKPKKKKRKPRKSQLDLSALTDEQVALAALQSSQILHLKLRKRYYAEALSFIRQIEGAMENIGSLLGSKNKPEVLEAIEFFRVAYEYQFSGAEVCDILDSKIHER